MDNKEMRFALVLEFIKQGADPLYYEDRVDKAMEAVEVRSFTDEQALTRVLEMVRENLTVPCVQDFYITHDLLIKHRELNLKKLRD